jgi:hypothetical protein
MHENARSALECGSWLPLCYRPACWPNRGFAGTEEKAAASKLAGRKAATCCRTPKRLLRGPAPGWWSLALLALLLSAHASAQDAKTAAAPEVPPTVQPDVVLPRIKAMAEGVTTSNPGDLSKGLHVGEKVEEEAAANLPRNTLSVLGDLDGDGIPEIILKWAIPDVEVAADLTPLPDSRPLWGTYLLSWNGAHWDASPLLYGIEDFTFQMINLGRPTGRGFAMVARDGNPPIAYPAVFRVRNHVAELLWDAQADNSRYEPLAQGDVEFGSAAPSELVVTGRADPGLLQFDSKGHRGFTARAAYHWDGKAYIPAKTEYFANQDYTLYRFISALHLHDYPSAYALIVPEKFLNSDSPTVGALQKFIQDNWPEFLGDQVFQAVEPPPGAAQDYVFVAPQADKQYRYRPTFSSDGKFLLTGLKRTTEALPPEPPIP